jgi:hypothetical protein
VENNINFIPFTKIGRYSREVVVTEKIDGTNASIMIDENNNIKVGSRTRWITPTDDNHGFAKWVDRNKEELLKLGVGHHFGEWAGNGIQRGYGLKEKKFYLFNTSRWNQDNKPMCCEVVPILWQGKFDDMNINVIMNTLRLQGSNISEGCKNPEGIVIYHTGANTYFKKTFEKDEGKFV